MLRGDCRHRSGVDVDMHHQVSPALEKEGAGK